MTDTWTAKALPNFKSYFGTALHGATITWYNNPAASGADIDWKNYMYVEFEQNLYSYAYSWYDSAQADDKLWFKGDTAFTVAG